ncbi:MAG: hypothetical protein R2697_03735 [Ilumatobacteraceae bacterium]
MSTALIGTRKGLFTLTVDDGTFDLSPPAFPGVRVTNAMRDPRDGALYVSLDHGHFGVHLHRSDDGGATWPEIAAPEYPPKPEGVADVNPMSQREVDWSTQLGWIIEPGHPDESGVLWCGTIPGGLFRSDDRGDSWQLVESLWNLPAREKWAGGGYDDAGIHSISIDRAAPAGSSECRAAAPGAPTTGVPRGRSPPRACAPTSSRPTRPATPRRRIHTGSSGATPRPTSSGPSTTAASTAPSTTAAWTEIPEAGPSTFGFAVAVHPADPDTAWFVPGVSDEVRMPVDGKLVVTRTRDGGATFDVLDDGLPDQAYDLIYRHALDVDDTGEQLLMGSTTGSLWWSGDAGDHWTEFSEQPPTDRLRPLLLTRQQGRAPSDVRRLRYLRGRPDGA